jgi:hypothetical protein
MSEWTAHQRAAYRGVSREKWLADVEASLEPKPVSEHMGMPRWDSYEVSVWKRPDEWFNAECAAYHQIAGREWTALVNRGLAPKAARKVGRQQVWNVADVQAFQVPSYPILSIRVPRRDPLEELDGKSEWTAAECAVYLGIPTQAWRADVQQGDAPKPVRSHGAGKYWDPEQVRNYQAQFEANAAKRIAERPLHWRIAALIVDDHYQVGDIFMSEQELCTRLGASRYSVRKALAELEASEILSPAPRGRPRNVRRLPF